MPDEMQDISHRNWINESYGVKILDYQTYIAPTYERVKKINDEMLLSEIKKLKNDPEYSPKSAKRKVRSKFI